MAKKAMRPRRGGQPPDDGPQGLGDRPVSASTVFEVHAGERGPEGVVAPHVAGRGNPRRTRPSSTRIRAMAAQDGGERPRPGPEMGPGQAGHLRRPAAQDDDVRSGPGGQVDLAGDDGILRVRSVPTTRMKSAGRMSARVPDMAGQARPFDEDAGRGLMAGIG